MHLDEQFYEWQSDSLMMKKPEDWRPVWYGLGILSFFIGLAFLRRYFERKQAMKIIVKP